MRLVRYMGAPPECIDQATTINGSLRTTANPCGMYCSRGDFDGWRAAARTRISEVIAKGDLTPAAMMTAKKILAEIEETTDPSLIDVGSSTRRMAELYRLGNCLSTVPPGEELPTIPDKPQTTEGKMQTLAITAVGLLAVFVFLKARRR